MANRGRTGGRLRKQWDSFGSTEQHHTVNGIKASGTTLTFETFGPSTVLRMLGEYIITPTSAPVVADACIIGVGIALVSQDAAVLGATALPDPIADPDYPWLYWANHAFHFASADVDVSGPASAVRHKYDIRSMRKAKLQEALVHVVEYFDFAGAPPMTVFLGGTRVLLGM